MTFRDRLRDLIDYRGFLDKEVAAKAGITKRAIDSYVGAEACMPSAEVAVKIANVLGVSVEYLVTGSVSNMSDLDKNIDIILSKYYKHHEMIDLYDSLPEDIQKNFLNLIKSIS